jgi:hypothetical protein
LALKKIHIDIDNLCGPKKFKKKTYPGALAIYIKKDLKAKRRIIEIQIFHHAKI